MLRLEVNHINLSKTQRTLRVKGERIVLASDWLLIEKTKNGKPAVVATRTAECGVAETREARHPGTFIVDHAR